MKTRRGVTLFELIIVMAVLSTVSVSVLGVFAAVTRQWSTQVSRTQTLLIANAAMDAMATELGQAMSVQGEGGKSNVFWMPRDQDAEGNYTPALNSGNLQFIVGRRVRFYLSDTTGTAGSGTILWREYRLLGPWTEDTAWSRYPGTPARCKYTGITSLTITTTGMPANNMVRITLTVAVQEGRKTSTETVQRYVYMSNHN